MVIEHKINEIPIRYSNAQWNNLFRKWVHTAKTARIQGYTKVSQCITAYKREIFVGAF